MNKKNNKQKRSLVFSTAVVITGCIATAVYVNQSMDTATDYKIDLSQMEAEQNPGTSLVNDPELSSGASFARVSGQDVVNTLPEEESVKKQEPQGESETGEKQKSQIDQETEKKQKVKEKGKEEVTETASQSVVSATPELSFSPEDKMGWPLAGDVILNYSMDSAVYFSTLMQYKYNPAVLIGADEGTNVNACARGQVVKIGESAEQGKYVVTNLGDGYEVTYGQLADLEVQEGSVVSRGQVIGKVAKTTKYYALEGDHVSVMITKDGEPVDPLSLFE